MMKLFGVYMMIFGILLAIRISNMYLPDKNYPVLVKSLIAPMLFLYSAFSIYRDKKTGWIMIVFLQFFLIGIAIVQKFFNTPLPPAYTEIGGTGFWFILLNFIIPVFIILFSNKNTVLKIFNVSFIFRISILLISILIVAYMAGVLQFN